MNEVIDSDATPSSMTETYVDANINKINTKRKRRSLRVLLLKLKALERIRKQQAILRQPIPIKDLSVVIPRKCGDGYIQNPKVSVRTVCGAELGHTIRPRSRYRQVKIYT